MLQGNYLIHSSILPSTYKLIHPVNINWAPSIQSNSVQSSRIATMLKKKKISCPSPYSLVRETDLITHGDKAETTTVTSGKTAAV